MKTSVLLCALCVFAGQLSAQQNAQVSGVVEDASHAGVPNALVTITNEDTGIRRTCRSGPDGKYLAAALAPGTYKFTVRKEGFQTLAHLGVRLEIAGNVRIDFILQLGRAEETITVRGNPAAVNTDNTSGSISMGQKLIGGLPLNGRSLLPLLELAPGVVITPAASGEAGQFSVRGQRPNANYFTVDGLSMNTGAAGGGIPAQFAGGSLPAMTAFGSLHSLAALDSVQEVRVEATNFAPQYGVTSGAQVMLSTRSGSNDLHGTLFEYLRNERLDAEDWFSRRAGAAELPSRLNDFGGSIGGPLRRDRTFFFLSYEGIRLRQPFTWNATVPSMQFRKSAPDDIRPLLNAFPLPAGRDLGGGQQELLARVSRPSSLDAGSVRIDHAFSRVSVFARLSFTPSRTDLGYASVNRSDFRTSSAIVGATAMTASGLTSDFRAGRTGTRAESGWSLNLSSGAQPLDLSRLFPPVPPGAFGRLSIAGVGSVVAGRDGMNDETGWGAAETISLTRSAHDVRAGLEYRRLEPSRSGPPDAVSVQFPSLAGMLQHQAPVFAFAQSRRVSSLIEQLSFFLQDSWRASSRTTVTYGSRWEFAPAPESQRGCTAPVAGTVVDEISSGVCDLGSALWRTRYSNFAPRVGVAHRLFADRKVMLRGGAGLFYDLGFSAAADALNGAPFNAWQAGAGLPLLSTGAAYRLVKYGVDGNLRLPYSLEWNLTLEAGAGSHGAVSVGYAGSAGHQLLRREASLGGGGETLAIAVATNHGSSSYHGLELQYRRSVARGLAGSASYRWSHSIDTGSWDSELYFVGSGLAPRSDRGSSNFDVRHSLSGALEWDGPHFGNAALRGWTVDTILRARSGFPIDVLAADGVFGFAFANLHRPDRVAGVPLWLRDATVPGGRRLNPAAFAVPARAPGSLGRNAIAGFGMAQIDAAVRRNFELSERTAVQVRVEAFNVLNSATPADPVRLLDSALFGRPASMLNLGLGAGSPGAGLAPMFQAGGPRSVQISARFIF